MKPRARLAAVLALVTLLVAGCGGADGPSGPQVTITVSSTGASILAQGLALERGPSEIAFVNDRAASAKVEISRGGTTGAGVITTLPAGATVVSTKDLAANQRLTETVSFDEAGEYRAMVTPASESSVTSGGGSFLVESPAARSISPAPGSGAPRSRSRRPAPPERPRSP